MLMGENRLDLREPADDFAKLDTALVVVRFIAFKGTDLEHTLGKPDDPVKVPPRVAIGDAWVMNR